MNNFEPEKIEENNYNGTTFVTDTFTIFKDVVFIGDSYSYNIGIELGFDTTIYSSPGLTIKELEYCFNSAKNNQKKYIVVFLGPNDFKFKGTSKKEHFWKLVFKKCDELEVLTGNLLENVVFRGSHNIL